MVSRHFIVALIAACMLLGSSVSDAQVRPVPTSQPAQLADRYIRADRLGITFISSAEDPASDERYNNALLLGAGWTRWPMYWQTVETSPGWFNWTRYDELIERDLSFGLQINAILLNRPEFHADGNSIAGLNEPVFADGSDFPGAGKAINPANPWARYVYEAVNRYKPGGILARARGLQPGEGVRVWEVWNEPDYPPFWSGGILAYARLLKVAYLAAHHADPDTTVMFGGLLYNSEDNWLARVLAIYENDPYRVENNWYMDAVAIHSYSYPWRSGWLTRVVRQTFIAYKIDKPIWLNETGVSVWDDYPGPVWVQESSSRQKLATVEQSAWYMIQSAAYAWVEGAYAVFHHQLYDDCGDQPPGTNFPPHNGELCSGEGLCFGNAFGLFRNESESICYSQHPLPGTPRTTATAFRMLAEVFGRQEFTRGGVSRTETGLTIISFVRPASSERIRVIWNRRFEDQVVEIEAEGVSAQLYTLNGNRLLSPSDGIYRIELGAAQPDNQPLLEPGDISAIGGPPIILVETVEGLQTDPADTSLPTPDAAPTQEQPLLPSSGPIVETRPDFGPILGAEPTEVATTDDLTPQTFVEALPQSSPATFTVRWGAEAPGGVVRYLVWLRVDGGAWQPWLETTRSEADYTGEPGSLVEFAVWAVDRAGNWSSNTDLAPQASTRISAP